MMIGAGPSNQRLDATARRDKAATLETQVLITRADVATLVFQKPEIGSYRMSPALKLHIQRSVLKLTKAFSYRLQYPFHRPVAGVTAT